MSDKLRQLMAELATKCEQRDAQLADLYLEAEHTGDYRKADETATDWDVWASGKLDDLMDAVREELS